MSTVLESPAGTLGIREVAEVTGISVDALRWYEREGLIPGVDRTTDGRRRYSPATMRFVRLVQALRRTGMPVAEVRDFVQIGRGVLENHPPRLAILERQAAAIAEHRRQLDADQAVIDAKIADYHRLIALGIDCEDETAAQVAQATRAIVDCTV
jgi:DNA-binding transcriptional MerR regulator